ncbi:hypothetical protein vseg_000006 [Gypsophila vaccaria]
MSGSAVGAAQEQKEKREQIWGGGSNNNKKKKMGSRQGGSGGGGGWWWWWVGFAVISAVCVSGPALYFKFQKQQQQQHYNYNYNYNYNWVSLNKYKCPVCACHCPPPPPTSLLHLSPGLANLSSTDCGKSDPDLYHEMGKQFVDLLTEELKLHHSVASHHSHHMNLTLSDARRSASLYQREADKCVAATETCESARERSQSFLSNEIKLTSLWELRARHLGWHPL